MTILELVSGQPDQTAVDRLLALVAATEQLDVLPSRVSLPQRKQRTQPHVVLGHRNPRRLGPAAIQPRDDRAEVGSPVVVHLARVADDHSIRDPADRTADGSWSPQVDRSRGRSAVECRIDRQQRLDVDLQLCRRRPIQRLGSGCRITGQAGRASPPIDRSSVHRRNPLSPGRLGCRDHRTRVRRRGGIIGADSGYRRHSTRASRDAPRETRVGNLDSRLGRRLRGGRPVQLHVTLDSRSSPGCDQSAPLRLGRPARRRRRQRHRRGDRPQCLVGPGRLGHPSGRSLDQLTGHALPDHLRRIPRQRTVGDLQPLFTRCLGRLGCLGRSHHRRRNRRGRCHPGIPIDLHIPWRGLR